MQPMFCTLKLWTRIQQVLFYVWLIRSRDEMESQSSFGDINDTDHESAFHDVDMECSEEQD